MNNHFRSHAAQAAKAELFNKAWTDKAFAARLESDPKSLLEELGGRYPDEIEIKVVRDTETVKHLHIPAPPPEGEISDGDLFAVQGGTSVPCAGTVTITIASVVVTLVTESVV